MTTLPNYPNYFLFADHPPQNFVLRFLQARYQELRSSSWFTLFVAKCGYRVHGHRAAGWDVGCEEC